MTRRTGNEGLHARVRPGKRKSAPVPADTLECPRCGGWPKNDHRCLPAPAPGTPYDAAAHTYEHLKAWSLGVSYECAEHPTLVPMTYAAGAPVKWVTPDELVEMYPDLERKR